MGKAEFSISSISILVRASLVAQLVKNSPAQRSLVGATEHLSTKLKQWSSGESVLLTAKHFNMGSPHSVSFHPSLMGWV